MRYYTVHLPRALNRGPAAQVEGAVGASEALGGAVLVREGINWLTFIQRWI